MMRVGSEWGADQWEAERNPAPPPKLVPMSLPALHLRPVPERRWIVPDWLPVRQVTLNYADGGIGKTLLALQLMAATALSGSWCGLQVEQCASVGLFSEDDETELHIRLDAVRRLYRVDFTDLAGVHPIDGTGQDNILAHFDGNHMLPTPRFRQLRECAMDTKARLVVIDTAATTFGGNENDRSQVTQYVGSLLTSLAQDIDGAVLLNAHPSVSGISNGDLRSGSTGWNNSARSRWAMGETLSLTWQEGAFVPTSTGGLASGNRKDAAEAAFLAALRAAPRPVFTDPRTSNYAPRVFHMTPHGADFRVPELAEAMRNLMGRGRVIVAEYKRDYKTAYLLREVE